MKKVFSYIFNMVKAEYKFILVLLLLLIIFEWPVNYYIIIGGGTSDVSSRIKVENKYESKVTFNISYVEELKGTVLTYLLSYVVPYWERESADYYKYNDKESIKDIEFRGDLDLLYSNSNATYWAYKLAGKDVEKIDSKLLDSDWTIKAADVIPFSFFNKIKKGEDKYMAYIVLGEPSEDSSNKLFYSPDDYISYDKEGKIISWNGFEDLKEFFDDGTGSDKQNIGYIPFIENSKQNRSLSKNSNFKNDSQDRGRHTPNQNIYDILS